MAVGVAVGVAFGSGVPSGVAVGLGLKVGMESRKSNEIGFGVGRDDRSVSSEVKERMSLLASFAIPSAARWVDSTASSSLFN